MTTTTNSTDHSRLAPEDAYNAQSSGVAGLASAASSIRPALTRNRTSHRNRSESRRRKVTWKKLLWVRQSFPDNYTDEETFLDHLQRNPRLQPYDFWPLVADSTVIVQQVCTIIIFICCFSGIYQERISPTTVVSWGTIGTVLGWVLWDAWVGREEASNEGSPSAQEEFYDPQTSDSAATPKDAGLRSARTTRPPSPVDNNAARQNRTASATSLKAVTELELHNHTTSHSTTSTITSSSAATTTGHPTGASSFASYSPFPPYNPPQRDQTPRFSPRNQQRLATAKSALLIYFALLGLSPLLKSLTLSTAKDSIWAMSFWLMCINVFFFDYGGAVAGSASFPASLSTNAALMASTVLASRLPSTTHVFSLTLFSIEVFGLFPVFRRYLKHVSWRYHALLTLGLVVGAGGGVGLCTSSAGGWRPGLVGVVSGCLLTGLAMGVCSWWLIGLQRYKNEIHGPWDPARPIIRRRWD